MWKAVVALNLALWLVLSRAESRGHRRQKSYLQGVVQSLCEVAVQVPGAFHWQTGELC